MQPVIVLMSSYRNRCKLSYKSSINLNQAAVVIYEKSNLSTCTLGHLYKMGYSCHLSSSSTWFYTQPCKKCEAMQSSFQEPFWWYSSGHRCRNCIQDQGCMGPQEGWARSPFNLCFLILYTLRKSQFWDIIDQVFDQTMSNLVSCLSLHPTSVKMIL